MHHPGPAVAAWWGYAEGNRTLLGIAVGIIVIAAVAYVVRRLWRR
jgi:hypothetical protein